MYFLDTYEVRQFNISIKNGKCESYYNSRVDKNEVLRMFERYDKKAYDSKISETVPRPTK